MKGLRKSKTAPLLQKVLICSSGYFPLVTEIVGTDKLCKKSATAGK